MKTWLSAATATVGVLVFPAAPAHAARLTVADGTGDAVVRGLDITSAQVRNRDSAIVATVAFDRNVRGDVIVSLDARHGSGLRIVHEHRLDSRDRTFVVPGSFTQEGVDRRCKAVSGDWHPRAASVTLRLPARCLDAGNYGAVRFAILTEGRSGDTDFAPDNSGQGPDVSAWISPRLSQHSPRRGPDSAFESGPLKERCTALSARAEGTLLRSVPQGSSAGWSRSLDEPSLRRQLHVVRSSR